MICVGYDCDYCKNMFKDKIDGWKTHCKAFPDGIPSNYFFKLNPSELKECNNGIGYEPVEGGNPFAAFQKNPNVVE